MGEPHPIMSGVIQEGTTFAAINLNRVHTLLIKNK